MAVVGGAPFNRIVRPGQFIWFKQKKKRLGPELLTNGDFSGGATGWSPVGAVSVVGGVARYTAAAVNDRYEQFVTLIVGAVYEITYTIVSISAGSVRCRLMGGVAVNGITRSTPGTYTERLTATPSNTTVTVAVVTASTSCDIDNISCKRVG